MTTIAYKDGIIAVDSRRSRSGLIVSDSINKIHWREHLIFILCGYSCDWEALIDGVQCNLQGGRGISLRKGFDASGLVYDTQTNKLYYAGYDKAVEIWGLDPEVPYALGSGESFALAALDFKRDPVQAVAYAATRDMYTGGYIWELILESRKSYVYNPDGSPM